MVGYLIINRLTIFWYPDLFTLLVKYLEGWGTYGHPVPSGNALGNLEFGGRLAFTSRIAGLLRDVVGDLISLYVAFVLTSFYGKAINGARLVPAFLVGLAAMVVTNALISFFLPRRRALKQMPAT
jgi:hypothetical protein